MNLLGIIAEYNPFHNGHKYHIQESKKALNPDLEIEGVVMTMFDGRTNLSLQVVEEVKKYFGAKVYRTLIPRNVRLSEAPSFGEPIIVFDKTATGAAAYEKLAKEFIDKNR